MGTIEIPLTPQPQRFSTVLGGIGYNLRFTYDIAQSRCWIVDIADADGALLVAGIPLVSGVDLLAKYRYLVFTGSLVVTTDRGAGEVPTFDGLGVTSHLVFVPD